MLSNSLIRDFKGKETPLAFSILLSFSFLNKALFELTKLFCLCWILSRFTHTNRVYEFPKPFQRKHVIFSYVNFGEQQNQL